MKIEDQVCSLELAKKLRELGVTQNSLWYWVKYGDEYIVISDEKLIIHGGTPANNNVFSAFTVAELGEMLNGCRWKRGTEPFEGSWECTDRYWNLRATCKEADARAIMMEFTIDIGGFEADWLNR